MKIQHWMVILALALAGGLIAIGRTSEQVNSLNEDMKAMRGWKDETSKQMSIMNVKLDLLLKANGITLEYPGERKKNGRQG